VDLIHSFKITDCQMNWELEKLGWQIDEKALRRLPAWVQKAKTLDLISNLVMRGWPSSSLDIHK
jgi:ribosomal protein L39E